MEIAPAAASQPRTDSETLKLREAACQFEALLLGQLLSAMEPEEGDALHGMAREQLAQALAAHGSLGLARMLERAMAARRIQAVQE
ncbi:MAG: hypothetical protein ACE15B_06655 [Bryobacteraceae bacterium]